MNCLGQDFIRNEGLLSGFVVRRVKGKIILVDDQKYEKDFLQRALKKRNWKIEIEYFSNADKALEHLKKNADEIFLIISDMAMPSVKWNGF